eukprot:SAG31_NODE_36646_length_311_cov_1.089623_1_plen_62_part_10
MASSPRKQVLLGTGATAINGIIVDDEEQQGIWKRLEGGLSQAGWTGPETPNASSKTPSGSSC